MRQDYCSIRGYTAISSKIYEFLSIYAIIHYLAVICYLAVINYLSVTHSLCALGFIGSMPIH